MKKSFDKTKFIICTVLAILLVIAIVLFGEDNIVTPFIPTNDEGLQENQENTPIQLEGISIEQSYEEYFEQYLNLNENILDVVAKQTLGNPNPFYQKLDRIISNTELSSLLRLMGSELQYTVVNTGYANNTNTSFLVEMSVSYPDMEKALQTNFVDKNLSVGNLTDKAVSKFIKDTNIGAIERNNGYLYVFFAKQEDENWYLVNVSDAQSSSMKLNEFGGVEFYDYDESKKDFSIYLPLGDAKEITEKDFKKSFHWNKSVIDCINDVLTGINEQQHELIFTDNSGVPTNEDALYYLEDTAKGSELYRDYQMMEIDTELADIASIYQDYADVEVKYYETEYSITKGYIVEFSYSYINKIYATKLLFSKTGEQFSDLSIEEYRKFIEDNKEMLLVTEQKTCMWWTNEEIDPARMLVNTLCDVVSDCTFGG